MWMISGVFLVFILFLNKQISLYSQIMLLKHSKSKGILKQIDFFKDVFFIAFLFTSQKV